MLKSRQETLNLSKEEKEAREAEEVNRIIEERADMRELRAERENYILKGKLCRDQSNQEDGLEIVPVDKIRKTVDKLCKDISVSTDLMARQQLNEIRQQSADLYVSTLQELEVLEHTHRKEIDHLREACRLKLDETLQSLGQKFVTDNDKSIAELTKEHEQDRDILKAKRDHEKILLDDRLRELSKVKFKTARCYVLLRRNGITTDEKDWTENEEKRKTADMIEDSQAKIAGYDKKIRELRGVYSKLEDVFETRARNDPDILDDLKYHILIYNTHTSYSRTLNTNILKKDEDDDANKASSIRSSKLDIDFSALLLTIRRVIDTNPQIMRHFEGQKPESGASRGKSRSRNGNRLSPPSSQSSRPYTGGALTVDGSSSSSIHHKRSSERINPPSANADRNKITSRESKRLNSNSGEHRRAGTLPEWANNSLARKKGKNVMFSRDQAVSNEDSIQSKSKTESSNMAPQKSTLGDRNPFQAISTVPEMGITRRPQATCPEQHTNSINGDADGRKVRRQSKVDTAANVSRRQSAAAGMQQGNAMASFRKVIEEEKAQKDFEMIAAKHALIDEYQEHFDKIRDSTATELRRLEDERKTLKILWKMKSEALKKMSKSESSMSRVLHQQENMVKMAVKLTKQKSIDQSTQCNLSGLSYADFYSGKEKGRDFVTEINLELNLAKRDAKARLRPRRKFSLNY
ncbi:MAG: hypothetical protein SGCHY_003142 [Lobulomycetales sp.]